MTSYEFQSSIRKEDMSLGVLLMKRSRLDILHTNPCITHQLNMHHRIASHNQVAIVQPSNSFSFILIPPPNT